MVILLVGLWSAFIFYKIDTEQKLLDKLMAEYHRGDGLLMDKFELCHLLRSQGLNVETTLCGELLKWADAQEIGLDRHGLERVLHKVVDFPGLNEDVRTTVKRSRTLEREGWFADYFVLAVGFGYLGYLYVYASQLLERRLRKVAQQEVNLRAHLAEDPQRAELQKQLAATEKERDRLLLELGQASGRTGFYEGLVEGLKEFVPALHQLYTGRRQHFTHGAHEGFEIEMFDGKIYFGGRDSLSGRFLMYQTSFRPADRIGLGADSCFQCTEMGPGANTQQEWALKRYPLSEARRERPIASELRKNAMSKVKCGKCQGELTGPAQSVIACSVDECTMVSTRSCPKAQCNYHLCEVHHKANAEHPGLVRYERVLECGKHLYVIMERLKGQDLYDLLKKTVDKKGQHDLWRSRYLHIFRDIVEALHYLHTRERPVYHNDMKVENVYVTDWDTPSTCSAKLIDFGYAYFSEPGLLTGIADGVESLRPPEVPISFDTDAADLYRLGGILNSMTKYIHANTNTAKGLVPPEVTGIIDDLRTANPAERIKTAEVLRRLEPLLAVPSTSS